MRRGREQRIDEFEMWVKLVVLICILVPMLLLRLAIP